MIKLGTYWVNPAAVIAIQDGAVLLVTGDWITIDNTRADAVKEALTGAGDRGQGLDVEAGVIATLPLPYRPPATTLVDIAGFAFTVDTNGNMRPANG